MSYNLAFAQPPAQTRREPTDRILRVQTSDTYGKTSSSSNAEQAATPSTATGQSPSFLDQPVSSPSSTSHQRFVLTDSVAFRYLEEDPSTTVLSRREKLQGYELFLVEQWACSRLHPTFVITTYTGDPKDTVWASVISVPRDEAQWSAQLRLYFRSLSEYHARRKETSLGTLMITNLSSFPSSLTIVNVPEGDIKQNRELFVVNENLKRLGCAGRSGLKVAVPNLATQAKFHQLYQTSDKIPLNSSVIELVKLCQVALVLFGKLKAEYADGLLCDVTEKAVNDWWVEFGADYYTIEPHDGILGPTTVAAILGMFVGARNRLHTTNAPVGKDAFDVAAMRQGISHFQKTQRIQKTRVLDRQTMERLRRVTAKNVNKDGWAVQRAFKTTVAELGGKGGEMVMGMVGAGDKAGIADIETVDIDRFVELVSGERAKWLWFGKPRKTGSKDMFSRLPQDEASAPPLDQGPGHVGSLIKRESTLEGHAISKRDSSESRRPDAALADDGDRERDPFSKRAVIKRATEKLESGSGFTRIKDKVGRRAHQAKPSRDDMPRSPLRHTESASGYFANHLPDKSDGSNETGVSKHADVVGPPTFEPQSTITKVLTETPQEMASSLKLDQSSRPEFADQDHDSSRSERFDLPKGKIDTGDQSRLSSGQHHVPPKLPFNDVHDIPPQLRRTMSTDHLEIDQPSRRHEEWWPRHLSFSIAEESVLTWRCLVSSADIDQDVDPRTALAAQETLSSNASLLQHKLARVSAIDAAWVHTRITEIMRFHDGAEADTQQLDTLYYPALEAYEKLHEDAHEIVTSNRAALQIQVGELTTLSDKLAYEVGGLKSKVDDVEAGVGELERLVEGVEERVRELEMELGTKNSEGWVHWLVRILTGIGTARE